MPALRKVIPFELPHLRLFTPQPSQVTGYRATIEGVTDATVLGQCFTIVRDNRVVMVCGIRPQQEGVGMAWSIIADEADRYDMLYAARKMLLFFASKEVRGLYRRVEMLVCDPFKQGHRFAGMLGFSKEGVMAKRGFNGEDVAMYART